MTERLVTQRASSDEIDLRELISVLWAGKWLIGGVSFVAGLVAVVVVAFMPNIYQSEALLVPAEQVNSAGLSALTGQLGGLASLAGVNLGKGEVNKVTVGLEVLKSRSFIAEFIDRHELLVPLLAAKKWESSTGKLELDMDIYDKEKEKWSEGYWASGSMEPSKMRAYRAFSEALRVEQDKETQLIALRIRHKSPVIAKQWAEFLIRDVNDQLRRRDVDEAQKSIEYLKQQLDKTAIAGMQQVFYQLIEKQMQVVLLANVREQYVFKVLDPPIVPEEKVGPRRFVIVVFSVFLGGLLAVFSVLLSNAINNKKT